jgi:site-specific recombinase XerC
VRVGNWLTAEEGKKLLVAENGDTLRSRRNRALLSLLVGCGLRRAEVTTLIARGTKRSVNLQRIILKDARSVNEIKSFLSLIQTVSALLLVIFAVLLLTGALSISSFQAIEWLP